MEELNKEQVKHDLENWSKKMREAMEKMSEIYKEWQTLYEEVKE